MWKLCFHLKELETQKDQESLPVAQMKARRIIESFENPFRMVGDDVINPQYCLHLIQLDTQYSTFPFLWFQYLPSSDVHISKNAKFDPSSKIFEVMQSCISKLICVVLLTTCSNVHGCTVSHFQISKRWKLQSIEQQQKELEAKRKAKVEAKEHAKKVAGNGI